jgi:hypothetical protein
MPSQNKISEQQTGKEQADERAPAPATQDRRSPLLQDIRLRTSLGAGWSAACSGSLDEAPAQASSAPGRQDFLSMPPPQAVPATKQPPPVLHAPRYPAKSSPSAQGKLGVSPSGVPGMEAPGPSFGGSYTPGSVAGSVFSAFRRTSGLLTRSIRMCAANSADRQLRTFPRAAFSFVDGSDLPKLDIIGSHKGPGWFSNLQREDQWSGSLYKLAVELKCYDFCHKLTAKSHTALKLLHLSQIEYLRFALYIAAG